MVNVDDKNLYKGNIAVYYRVSTAWQNINQQINLAEIYLSQNNIDSTDVTYFFDDSISANKLSVDKRPELAKLLKEIRDGKVRTVIVQSRDRLARNFYEYIELVKEFYKYDVNVEFTDSGQVKFSDSLISEGLYSMLAQAEAEIIASKTHSAAQQLPNSIRGLNVIGKRNEKKHILKPEMVDEIKVLLSTENSIHK